jgi:tetratricopeptide (TPR) repeat protein
MALTILASPIVLAQTADEFIDSERPWAREADRLFAEGQLEKALKLYEELSLAYGEDGGLWLRIAMIHLAEGRAGPALEAAETAFGLDPSADAYLVLGQCQIASGAMDEGVGTLERGLQQHSQDVALLESLAMVSLGRQEWAKAGGLLRELIRLDPDQPDYRMDLARILVMSNDHAAAEEQLVRILELQPNSPDALALLGRTQLLQGRPAEAREQFEGSLALQESAEAYAGLGAVAFMAGDLDAAVANLQKAQTLDPQDADVLFNLGNAYVQRGDVGDAIAAYEASIELDPRAASSHSNLGILYLNLLRVNGARHHLQRAMELNPALPEPYLHLARIAAAEFDFDGAIVYYRGYQQRQSSPEEAARIDQVIADLEIRAKESREALARGEIHLLQLMVYEEETAEEIIRRVEEGEDFYTLAQQNSQLADVAGIDAGFVDPHGLSQVFRDPILKLEVGQMTAVLPGANGYYVFMRVQ